MMRLLFVFALVAVGCMLAAGVGAAEKKPDRPKATKIAGVLKAVDVKENTVTITVTEKKEKGKKEAGSKDETVKVSAETKIRIDGKDATIKDLAALAEKGNQKAAAMVVEGVTKVIMAGEKPKGEKKERPEGEKKKRGGDSQI